MLRIVGLFVVLLQVGCALSPQQVVLKPTVIVPAAAYGKQESITIRVEDHRSTPVIGTRGGVYGETSTIELGNDYKTETAFAIANVLTRWGFRPQVGGNDTDDVQFVLGIEKITYAPDKNPAVGKIHIAVSVSVLIQRGKQRYQGNYSASGEIGYVTVPTEAKNSKQINTIFSLALQKAFEDKGLVNFLQ